jgi:hypothetical protein
MYTLVTGIGKYAEWKWLSDKTACARTIGLPWSEPYTAGASLFECLTRRKHRHKIKRVVKVTPSQSY